MMSLALSAGGAKAMDITWNAGRTAGNPSRIVLTCPDNWPEILPLEALNL